MYRRLNIPSNCISENRVSINVSENVLPHSFWEWLLIPFVILCMTVSFIAGWSGITILYGAAFGWLFLIYFLFLYQRLNTPPEVLIYFIWIIWSLTGMLNATNTDLYLMQLRTIIQMGVMIFLIAAIVALRRNIFVIMLAIAIGGIIITLSAYYTGEFLMASYLTSHFQAEGLTGNSNSLAYHLLFVIFAMFCFWESKSSRWQRIILSSIIAIAVVGIILSGSRKGFLGVSAFILLWVYFCQGKKFLQKPVRMFIILLILLASVYAITDYAISHTYLGKRFFQVLDIGRMSTKSGGRIELYREGFDIIRDHPVLGVGLNQFRTLSSSGKYSHSDYIEVAANTGVFGFALYFSVYVVLWLRLNRIKKLTDGPHLLYIIGFFKAAIITILLVAFGRPNITSKLTWIFLAGAIGYSWSVERVLLMKAKHIKRIERRKSVSV